MRFPTVRDLNAAATGHGRQGPSACDLEPSGPPGIEINAEFQRALDLIDSRVPVVFVTGRAGTGKSTLIHYLRETASRNLAIVAPTGVAALNARGQTIHSFFKFPPWPVDRADIRKVRDRTLYEELEVLIVDEVSMVRADLLDNMDQFLRLNTGRRALPFGGVQLVLVGDLFQLPPIVATEEEARLIAGRYSSSRFFSAHSLQDCSLAAVELERVYRQRDEHFLGLLNAIREPRAAAHAIRELNARCVDPAVRTGAGAITLTCTNRAANALNDHQLANLPGQPTVFVGSTEGLFEVRQQQLPAPYDLALKVGAQVMFTKNDKDRRWVNGTVGTVTALGDCVQVQVAEEGRRFEYEVERERWEAVKYDYDHFSGRVVAKVIGAYVQFPLMLAWAVTIHKAQGKTMDRVVVDLGRGAFEDGQVYVALSRCRTLEGLRLRRPIREREVRCSPEVLRFYEALRETRRGQGEGSAES